MIKLRHRKTFHPVPSPQSLAINNIRPKFVYTGIMAIAKVSGVNRITDSWAWLFSNVNLAFKKGLMPSSQNFAK
ncbi:MAG: hypothetical protein RM338_21755 [Nostoc sp. DedQUE12a]|nr:hypothetical protein [Nostoc sp. DedQUE12a]